MTVAQILEQTALTLQKKYGDDSIPRSELVRFSASLSGQPESSFIPSDFCYNRTNFGIQTPNQPMFIRETRGLYKFVGTDYKYTGLMYHKPRGEEEKAVGEWHQGVFELYEADMSK